MLAAIVALLAGFKASSSQLRDDHAIPLRLFATLLRILPDLMIPETVICLPLFTVLRSYASAVLGVVILSVCLSARLSVTRVLCDQSKEPIGDIFTPHKREVLLVFCHLTVVGRRRPLSSKMGDRSDPPPSKIAHVYRFPPVTSQQ